jgi:adenosylhomocysteine nucleosidase
MTLPPLTPLAGRRVLFAMALGQEYLAQLQRRFTPLFTGVGPIDAAIAVTGALAELKAADALPDLIVSLGSAGSRRRPLGSVHQIARVSWRDMDASALGFERGVTPFADHARWLELATPLPLPLATLSTGGDVVSGDAYAAIDADLVDMETFAVVRAAARFGVPVLGLRGVSDGPGELAGIEGWTALLEHLDAALAEAVDGLAGALPQT